MIGNNTTIGGVAQNFTGNFNGDGHTITVAINLPATPNLGLFRAIGAPGVVENLTVAGSVTGTNNPVGALAGLNGGRVTNSRSSASVTGGATGIGGIGGLVGNNQAAGIVEQSSAFGNVTAAGATAGAAGGLVGVNWPADAAIINSYATGTVSGVNFAGGIAGLNRIGGGNRNRGFLAQCNGVESFRNGNRTSQYAPVGMVRRKRTSDFARLCRHCAKSATPRRPGLRLPHRRGRRTDGAIFLYASCGTCGSSRKCKRNNLCASRLHAP